MYGIRRFPRCFLVHFVRPDAFATIFAVLEQIADRLRTISDRLVTRALGIRRLLREAAPDQPKPVATANHHICPCQAAGDEAM